MSNSASEHQPLPGVHVRISSDHLHAQLQLRAPGSTSQVDITNAPHKYTRVLEFVTLLILLEDDSETSQIEALVGLDRMLPLIDPLEDRPQEENVLYNLISETRASVRLGYLLASPSDQILTLAVKVHEKIPWGTAGFEFVEEQDVAPPGVDVAGILLRRLMSPDCAVFGPATQALSLFLSNCNILKYDDVLIESGFFASDVPRKIFQLAASPDLHMQFGVASFLPWIGSSIETDPDLVETCVDAGIAKAFHALLTSPYDTVRDTAVDAILSFVKDARCCDAFVSADILEALAEQGSSTDNTIVSQQASHAVVQILKHASRKPTGA